MTAQYSAGRGLVVVGLLMAAVATGAVVVASHALPAGVSLVFAPFFIGASVTASVGQVYVGFVLAFGGRQPFGVVGPTWWARAACVGFGVGPFLSPLVDTVTSLAAGAEAAALVTVALSVLLALVTGIAALGVARAGALVGFARWALGIIAVIQLVAAALGAERASALTSPSVALSGGVLPIALVVVGITYIRSGKASDERDDRVRFVTRAGRTSAQWVVDAPLAEAVDRQRSFLAGQRRFTAVRIDEQGTTADLELAARPNWAAWGGRILLRLQTTADRTTTVDARWSPSVVTTILTWDQGRRDLEALASGMARLEGAPRDDVPVS